MKKYIKYIKYFGTGVLLLFLTIFVVNKNSDVEAGVAVPRNKAKCTEVGIGSTCNTVYSCLE